MKKLELIHLHGLLAEIAARCERENDLSIDLTAYESLETRPTSIQKPKDTHRDATLALAEAITAALHDEQAVEASANAD
jgi:hypothetical protein